MSLTIRRTPRTGRGFAEPLLEVTNGLPLHMVLIRGGTFMMGQTEAEKEELIRESGQEDYEEYYQRELPQHKVEVPPFFLGRYPVTQAQYEALMDTNPATAYEADRFVAPDKPVVGVTWNDAMKFCDRLSERTGREYRLPSEAEWEYACRADTTTPFYFGKTLTTEVANYNGNYSYADGPKGEYRNALTPVEHFGIANAFGLCDMHGNVYDWCQDHWHENYDGAPADGTAWVEGGDSDLRVIRGGSWNYSPRNCRSAYRDYCNPGYRDSVIGFRVCCSAPRPL